jgi:hypothetical protein
MIDSRTADMQQLTRIMNSVRKLEKLPINEVNYAQLTKLRVEALLIVDRIDEQNEALGRRAKAKRVERQLHYPRAVRG